MIDPDWFDFRKYINRKNGPFIGLVFLILLTLHPRFEMITKLLVGYAWPILILVCVILLKNSVVRAIDAIAQRIGDPNTSVRISKEGLELKRQLEDAKLKNEELNIENSQLRAVAEPALKMQAPLLKGEGLLAAKADDLIPNDLRKLADEYMAINEPDYRKRVNQKDEYARTMAALAFSRGVSKEKLASELHEGLILTLASMILLNPEPDDYKFIYRISDEVNRLHVKYRIVLAIGRLDERGLIPAGEMSKLFGILESYRKDADDSLKRRIEYTQRLLGPYN